MGFPSIDHRETRDFETWESEVGWNAALWLTWGNEWDLRWTLYPGAWRKLDFRKAEDRERYFLMKTR
jgi:hypothetical protein